MSYIQNQIDEKEFHFTGKGKDGLKLHFVRRGSGKPVILLHGWPGFWYDWRAVIPQLSQHADVIAPDLRGFGDSEKPEGDPVLLYAPEVHAADLITLMDSLGIQKAVFAAHDIGATIAQTLATVYPDRVESLVLLNPPYPGIGTRRFAPEIQGQFWYQHFHNLQLAEKLVGYNKETVGMYIEHFYRHWIGNNESLRNADLQYIIDKYSNPGAFKASIAYYRARANAKTKQAVSNGAVRKIRQPTSILWGKKDPIILAEWSDRMDEYFTRASLNLLEGVGHFVPFEAPDQVIDAIIEQLNKDSTSSNVEINTGER
jgi:pimeloyl-ACP methyl ester carboxylesterase